MTTMEEIQRFSHTLHNRDISVSAVMLNGEPWFRAKDVAVALGYANHAQAIRHNVDEQDRTQLKDFKQLPGSSLPGCNKGDVETHSDSEQTTSPLQRNEGAQVFISETGLYSLIMSSQKTKAKAFQHWVTSEVLPNIRKKRKNDSLDSHPELTKTRVELEIVESASI